MACQAKSTWGESGRPGSEALPAERRENRFSDLGMRGGHLRTPWRGRHILMLLIILIICPHMLIISVHYLYHFLSALQRLLVLIIIMSLSLARTKQTTTTCAITCQDGALLRATLQFRSAPCHNALLATLVPALRLAKTWPALLRRAASSEYACVAYQSRKPFPRFSAGNASLAGRSLSPHVFFAPVARGGGLRRVGVRCCAAPRRPNMPATRAHIASHSSDSPLATLRCPAGRSRLTPALRPSPAVSRGVVARDVVISPCAAPRLLCFHRPRRRLA